MLYENVMVKKFAILQQSSQLLSRRIEPSIWGEMEDILRKKSLVRCCQLRSIYFVVFVFATRFLTANKCHNDVEPDVEVSRLFHCGLS